MTEEFGVADRVGGRKYDTVAVQLIDALAIAWVVATKAGLAIVDDG